MSHHRFILLFLGVVISLNFFSLTLGFAGYETLPRQVENRTSTFPFTAWSAFQIKNWFFSGHSSGTDDDDSGNNPEKRFSIFSDQLELLETTPDDLFADQFEAIEQLIHPTMSEQEAEEYLRRLELEISQYRWRQFMGEVLRRKLSELGYSAADLVRISNDKRHLETVVTRYFPETGSARRGMTEVPVVRGQGGGGAGDLGNARVEKKLPSSNSDREAASGKKGDEGSGDEHSEPPFDLSALPAATESAFTVSKEITWHDQQYRFTTELTGENRKLFCLVCQDLVQPDASQCKDCFAHICTRDVSAIKNADLCGKSRCPFCRSENGYSVLDFTESINDLRWKCQMLCGQEIATPDIEMHLDSCRQIEFDCQYPSCDFHGDYRTVEAHEQTCGYQPARCPYDCNSHLQRRDIARHQALCQLQPVSIGVGSIPLSVFNLLHAFQEEPGAGVDLTNLDPGQETDVKHAVAILLASLPKSQAELSECEYCKQKVLRYSLPAHEEQCSNALINCEACHEFVARKAIVEHLCRSCESNLHKCDRCKARLPLKDFGRHHIEDCPLVECQVCALKLPRENLSFHTKACRLNMQICGSLYRRYTEGKVCEYPVYLSRNKCSVCIFVPAVLHINPEGYTHQLAIKVKLNCYTVYDISITIAPHDYQKEKVSMTLKCHGQSIWEYHHYYCQCLDADSSSCLAKFNDGQSLCYKIRLGNNGYREEDYSPSSEYIIFKFDIREPLNVRELQPFLD